MRLKAREVPEQEVNLKRQVKALNAKYLDLKSRLEGENAALKRDNNDLRERIAYLLGDVADLERKLKKTTVKLKSLLRSRAKYKERVGGKIESMEERPLR